MAATEKEVVVDALPYFDQGYDETGVREAVIIVIKPFLCILAIHFVICSYFFYYRPSVMDRLSLLCHHCPYQSICIYDNFVTLNYVLYFQCFP